MGKRRRSSVETQEVPVEKIQLEQEDRPAKEMNAELFKNIRQKLKLLKFKNDSQKAFYEGIGNNQIALVSGPAGTAKSMLCVWKALDLLTDSETPYRKIVIVKPLVTTEDIGYLPGDLDDKTAPFTFSAYYLVEKIIGKRRAEKLITQNFIETMAIAFLRGVNLDNTILIFEESQNCTEEQMLLILTRLGENSVFLINGDLEQSDLKKKIESGLSIATRSLRNTKDIFIFNFDNKDIVRNPLISVIIEKFKGK